MILMMIRRWEDIKVEASEESSSCGHVTSQAVAQAQILSFVIIIIIIVIIVIIVVIIIIVIIIITITTMVCSLFNHVLLLS